jgi:cytochrome c551/c552
MKIQYLPIITLLAASPAAFAAGDAAALFKKSNCGACHTAASKSVGPSLADIAAKYSGNKDAQSKLEAKTRNGGAGSFGTMPMPPTPKSVSDDDIKALVAWILSQK